MYEQIERNARATWLLLALFVLLILALGYAIGQVTEVGYAAIPAAAVIALVSASASYFYSDRVVLGISGAREVRHDEQPFLHNAVEGLAIAAGLPKPRVYLIQDSAPNAFATGRDPQHAAMAVTTGLLEKLNRLELEGVVAHEMAHIQHMDVRLSTLVVVLVGTVALVSDWFRRSARWGGSRRSRDRGGGGLVALVALLLAIFAPLAAQLIRFAISRRREYLADAGGAMLTRYPAGLAGALEKLDADRDPLEVANKATAHLYIVNPLKEWGGSLNGLFNTHPPIDDRIRRLREMAVEGPPLGASGPGA
ncbi:MAG: M48 family metallopeptidase [Armatimonadetes bacterium]|nr:M48 family metallopeptidase [Armatimonadota bacterium]